MILQGSNDLAGFISLIDVCRAMNEGDVTTRPASAVDLLYTLIPDASKNLALGARTECPRMAAAWGPTEGALVVHGTDLSSQSSEEVRGYFDTGAAPNQSEVANPVSSWTVAAADTFYVQLFALGFFNSPRITVFGHSAGHGVVGAVLRRLLANGTPVGCPTIFGGSIGGNGWSGPREARIFNSLGLSRFMNDDDPVPLAPWSMVRMFPSVISMVPTAIQRINNMVHTPYGQLIDVDGNISSAITPTRGVVDSAIDMATWFASFIGDTRTPHQTGEYRRRLTLAIAKQQYSDPVVTGNNDTPRVPIVGLQPEPTVAQAQQFLTTQAAAAVAASNDVAAARGDVVQHDVYKARKFNGAWVVAKGGAVVAISNGKRNAKAKARQMNHLVNDSARLGIVVPALMPQ